MRRRNFIYLVHGPDAQWGDGYGVLGAAATKREAQTLISELVAECREYGDRAWTGGRRASDYHIAREPLSELELPSHLQSAPVDEIVDWLNQQL